MAFYGRTRELGRLRAALDAREASLVVVSGPRGVGKTALVSRVVTDYPHVMHRCAPLADEALRATLAPRLAAPQDEPLDGATPSWNELLSTAAGRAEPGASGFVLVLDDAHRLTEGRARLDAALPAALERARAEGRALHVVLVSHAPFDLPELQTGPSSEHPVLPLTLRAALPLLPGSSPRDAVRAYATFGGLPRVLEALDRSVTLGTNIRSLLLDRDGALAEAGAEFLERDVQNPTRYYAVLRALSKGEADWATVHAGVPDLTSSGQVAPYLKKLEGLGLVRTRRSLDAKAGSRARRYRVADPFLAFWFRFVLPRLYGPDVDSTTYLNESIRPVRDTHTSWVFADVCRQFMVHDAIELLGANAREAGGLWGAGYDIDAAGILGSGAAYYGHAYWTELDGSAAPVARVDREVRETRYGFGREARLRLLFAARPLPRAVEREVARRHDVFSIDVDALVGPSRA